MKRYHDERGPREPSPLLDWQPLARTSDPVTSHEAGEHVAANSRDSQCAELLRMINATPGHIAAYYVGLSGFDGAWRRCSDLVTAGKAHYSGTQVGPSGRRCGRLWPGAE